MDAQSLINQLTQIAEQHNVRLSDLEVNYRIDFDSDIEEINWVCEDLYDPETNSTLKSVTLFCDDTGLDDYDDDEY